MKKTALFATILLVLSTGFAFSQNRGSHSRRMSSYSSSSQLRTHANVSNPGSNKAGNKYKGSNGQQSKKGTNTKAKGSAKGSQAGTGTCTGDQAGASKKGSDQSKGQGKQNKGQRGQGNQDKGQGNQNQGQGNGQAGQGQQGSGDQARDGSCQTPA